MRGLLRKMQMVLILNSLVMVLLFSNYIVAQVPGNMSYQGILKNADGIVLDGEYNLHFRIYDSESETTSIWDMNFTGISINEGIFSVILENLDNLTFDKQYWLGITINGGEELLPKTVFTSVPYALMVKEIPDNIVTHEKFSTNNPASSGQVLTYNGSVLSWETPSTGGGLTLPYSGDFSGTQNAFEISHIGGNGSVLKLMSSNTSNSEAAMIIEKQGSGEGLYIKISDGVGWEAIRIDASSGQGIDLNLSGTSGRGIDIDLTNENNNDTGIDVSTNGTGKAGRFSISNTSNANDIIDLSTNGTGKGIDLNHSGANGIALDIDITGTTNDDELIKAQTKGTGVGAWFEIQNENSSSPALIAITNGTGRAAEFEGDVKIYGNLSIDGKLSKDEGTFKIDHPLDPQNKYLYHSFVESPDMMNIYNGNINLNYNGEGVVELPKYFEALNIEFRYQLTCVGAFAPVYIAEKISGNSFKISGGTPNLEVSWQVTGIRNDPYAKENRIEVEVDKIGDEKGRYLHYKEYNVSEDRSIESLKNRKTK